MYYPYFRGKQFELIAIRETAGVLARSGFVPIIEPVKEALIGLEKSLAAVRDAGGKAVVIVNPHHGHFSEKSVDTSELLQKVRANSESVSAGILLKENITCDEALILRDQHKSHNPIFVHAGFTEAKTLAQELGKGALSNNTDIFFETHCGKIYRKNFSENRRVLLRDGFKRRRNADHPLLEEFSDLHVTFDDEGMDGFGDFLIVGDDYSETGGLAYAVAIHLTFIDPENDDVMYVYHFVSDTKDTPTDPAGKFAEALAKLMENLDSGESKILKTSAIEEFRSLSAKGHFPGLGYVKKLSMKHHIETLADYFS